MNIAKINTAWVDGYTFTWTEQVIADSVVPDTDTVIPMGPHITMFYCEWDTNGATTGAPTFDFHIETSFDGTNYTTSHYATLVSAAAKDVRGSGLLTPPKGAKSFKARLDVNTANLAAAEYVTLKIRPMME